MKTDNELIAEFMGGQFLDSKNWHELHHKEMPFEKSWDWLMPVIQKIEQIHSSTFKYDIEEIKQNRWPKDKEYTDVICLPICTPMVESYQEVVKFIKWYNSTPQPKTEHNPNSEPDK